MAAFSFIRAKIVARLFCAAGVRADAPAAKITLAACCLLDSGGREACCTGSSIDVPLAVPTIFFGAGARCLGGAAFASDGTAGGREGVIGGGGGSTVITFDLGFAGGTGALVLFAIFVDGRVGGVSLRVGLRAIRTGAFLSGFRFATARRLRSSLGGTSFTVRSSRSRRTPSVGGRGAKSLLIGIRLGGAKSVSPKLGSKTRVAVSTLWPVSPTPKTLKSTSTVFE